MKCQRKVAKGKRGWGEGGSGQAEVFFPTEKRLAGTFVTMLNLFTLAAVVVSSLELFENLMRPVDLLPGKRKMPFRDVIRLYSISGGSGSPERTVFAQFAEVFSKTFCPAVCLGMEPFPIKIRDESCLPGVIST